jgi:hypothetical protein
MNRNNRHLQPKKKQTKSPSKPYVPLTSIYEQLRPLVTPLTTLPVDLSTDYLSILEMMSAEEITLALKNKPINTSEARVLFERLQPHQRRALLEERALHEYSASNADASTGGYDGGGPRAVSTGYQWSDPDGQDWYNRVVTAGGSITDENQAAFDTAFQSLKTTIDSNEFAPDRVPLWNHVGVGYFFIGQESFTDGLFVPFVGPGITAPSGGWTTAVNNGPYTSSDYSKVDGLIGDGATKFLTVDQLNNNDNTNWPVNSRMGYAYKNLNYPAGVTNLSPVGTTSTSTRVFGMNATYQDGYFISGYIYVNNASRFPINNAVGIPQGLYGTGIISSEPVVGKALISIGGTNALAENSGSPSTTLLANTKMLIGKHRADYDIHRTLCAILGRGFNNETTSNNSFKKLDVIMSTLKNSLT